MPSIWPLDLRRAAAGVALFACLGCPSLWGSDLSSHPKILTALWQKHFSAQLTGLDVTRDGQMVALTVVPVTFTDDNRLYIYDGTGRELWSVRRDVKILGVSLSEDGQYVAIGLLDFAIALFSKAGEVLWERKSVGLPQVAPRADMVVAFNNGIGSVSNTLLEVFRLNGEKAWSLRRKGRVWRTLLSARADLFLSLWNGEVLLIDRQQRLLWQQIFVKDIVALAISPEDAQYFAVGTGVLDQGLHLYERSGRLLWRHNLALGVTELSLAKQGAFLLSYGNTIRGQHLALYARNGQLQWTYHLQEPASESSKGVIATDAPLVVAGIERDQQYYLQGFSLAGELLWIAPMPEPIFDFRVSRDGRYIAAATTSTLFFFDMHPSAGAKAQLQ
jgi:outer membrane protein assembly factor BamB